MTTFSHILPAVTPETLPGEPNATGSSTKAAGLPGLFETIMTQALSPAPTRSAPGNLPAQPDTTASPEKAAGLPGLFETSLTQTLSAAPTKGITENEPVVSVPVPLAPGNHQGSGKIVQQQKGWQNSQPVTAIGNGNVPSSPGAQSGSATAKSVAKTANPPAGNDKNTLANPAATAIQATPEAFINQVLAATVPVEKQVPKFNFTKVSTESPQSSPAGARTSPISGAVLKANPLPITWKGSLPANQPEPAAQSTAAEKTTSPASKEELAVKDVETSAANPAVTNAPLKEMIAPKISSSTETDSNSSASPPAPGDFNGTSIAKQDTSMKQAEETNKIAGQTEKVLPGSMILPAHEGSASAVSPRTEPLATAAAVNSATAGSDATVSAASAGSGAVTALNTPRDLTLERTQDMVTVNATRLTDSGNNSMQVVIKPDAGTQLSLELRQQGANVQVQAVLQHGDFNQLNQQWPELQQRLEQSGIHLASLTDDGASANHGSRENMENEQKATGEVVPSLTLADAPAGTFTRETTPVSSGAGWETWA